MADEETKTSSKGSENSAASKAGKKKKKSRKRKQQPKPGDPDYKTPTQLRNARKRRKKKQDKAAAATTTTSGNPSSSVLSAAPKQQLPYGSINDPSLKYLSNPKAAPTVRNAIKFFREKTNARAGTNHEEYFPVTCGPKLGWRTVARLAVRSVGTKNDDQNKLRIGLFVPGSHELLPVPDCPVHHRKINGLVKVLEETCNSLGVPALDDDDDNGSNGNTFGLRYIAIAVERKTKRQQLVLVWKEPATIEKSHASILDDLVRKLVKKSADKTEQDIRLQSVWIHYNNTWKHSNSIFDREGRWETKFVEGETKTSKSDDPLFGSIREAMLPLAQPKNPKGDSTKTIVNPTSTLDKINVPLYFPPQVFRQANLDGFAKIILRIREWLHEQQSKEPAPLVSTKSRDENPMDKNDSQPNKRKRRRGKRDTSNSNTTTSKQHEQDSHANDGNSSSATPSTGRLASLGHCLELYGGVGTIGLNLVDYFDSLDSSDENPFNEACFRASADQIQLLGGNDNNNKQKKSSLDPSKRSKITYTSKSASDVCVEHFDSLKKARVVVVDPPRKGLDPPVLEALCSDYDYGNSSQQQQQEKQHLVYVSCGFDAFRRDYRALVEHSGGLWTLDRAEGHILFPGSDAIETLAFFTRNK